jgi:peptidoglycan/xylan/chitin deacetylase (PgdA/CDA1 family)
MTRTEHADEGACVSERIRRRPLDSRRRAKTQSNAVLAGVAVLAIVLIVVGVIVGKAMLAGGVGSHAPQKAVASTSANASEAGKTATPTPPAKPSAVASASAAASASASAASGSAKTWTPVADPAMDQAVPVLMYHHIMPNPSNSIAITPEAFDVQMGWLKDHGFHPISIAQMDDFIHTGKRLPENPVLITFDDGRMNQITYGVPILKKYGFTATFFVVKKWVVTTSPSFFHAADITQLVADGFDVQSHTTNHIQIHPSKVSGGGMETYAHFKKRYWDPTYGMRMYMQQDLGTPAVFALAYPGGRFNAQAEQLAGEAGYDLAFTTDSGYATYEGGTNAELLPRWNTGARGTTLSQFAYIMNGAIRAGKKHASGK